MPTEVIVAIMGLFGAVITSQSALIIKLVLRNGPRDPNPHDPDKVRLGDVSVGWWMIKMDEQTKAIVEAIAKLK